MDDIPLTGQPAKLLTEGGDRVDRLGLFLRGLGFLRGFFRSFLVDGCVLGSLGQGSLFGVLSVVGGLDVLLSVRSLDDVELVLNGLRRLDGVVQVRVRNGGCFFLDT